MTSPPKSKFRWRQEYFDGHQLRAKPFGTPIPSGIPPGVRGAFNLQGLIKAAKQQDDKRLRLEGTVVKKAQLFVDVKFIASSGQELSWKVECNAISEAEWDWAAARVAERFTFREVHGIPGGGLPFEKALRPYIQKDGHCFLIVDDVLTTGGSMEKAKEDLRRRHKGVPRIGVVLFARVSPPPWIGALWQHWGGQ